MCDISKNTEMDQEAGDLHSGLQEFHDMFLTPHLDIVTSDPAKFLAWLVLISTLITLLVGHLVYLGLLCLLSITWLYLGNISLKAGREEEQEEEEEWLLNRFLCFLHQLDNETSDIGQQERGEESETEEGSETASSAVTLQPADSSSASLADHQLEEWEDFEFITAQDLSS